MKIKRLMLGIFLSSTLLTGLFFLMQSSVFAGGNTYYVDDDCDSNGNGSIGDPYCTIQEAANVVAAGDTVLINPGTYGGGITVDTSGTAVNPITFQANGGIVVIEGSGSERDAFFITEANYIIVDGLTIQHANRAGVRISFSDHVTV